MTDENRHMDEAFKLLNEKIKVKYDASFWLDAEAKLNDDHLDEAYRKAVSNSFSIPSFDLSQEVDEIFMDAAFIEASFNQTSNYNPEFFEGFKTKENELQMNEAYQTAASSIVADYLPKYWNEADIALRAEGLHYEYDSAYWQEAKRLLDKSDRRIFFAKWSAIASVLLLISFSTQFIVFNDFDQDLTYLNSVKDNTVKIATFGHKDNSSIGELLLREKNTLKTNESPINRNINLEINKPLVNEVGDVNRSSSDVDRITKENNIISLNENLNSIESAYIEKIDESAINKTVRLIDQEDEKYGVSDLYYLENNEITKLNSTEINNIENNLVRYAPMTKINKGLDNPKGMNSVSFLMSAGIGNKWGMIDLIPTYRTSLGIEYNFAPIGVFKNMEFGINGNLNHIRQNSLGVEKRASVYKIDGSVDKYWYKLQLKDIIFANINFNVAYRLTAKHKIKIGAGLEHLVGTVSNLSSNQNNIRKIETRNNNWGVTEGINKMDVRVSLGYECQLLNRLSLQINGNYGLFDRTNNEYMEKNQKDLEMNVTAGIKYTLFRKI